MAKYIKRKTYKNVTIETSKYNKNTQSVLEIQMETKQ